MSIKYFAKIAIATILLSISVNFAHADSTKVYITVHSLKDGKTLENAEAYYKKLTPVFNRHGLFRLDGYKISAKILGHPEVSPVIMHIWKLNDLAALTKITSDKEYLTQIPLRDTIFNMPKMQGWLGEQQ